MIRARVVFGLALLVPLLAAAAPSQQLLLGNQRFDFAVAADPESRQQGLMGRELTAGTGMLFDFPAGTRPAIWMHNMRISLDLVFVDTHGRIKQLFANVPPCRQMPCAIYQAAEPLRYVLEIPAGTIQALGIKAGDQLDMGALPALPPAQ